MAITHPSSPPTTNQTKPSSPPKQPPQITLHPLTKSDLPVYPSWNIWSNFKLCEDVFVRGDEYMFKACGKERWLKLNILIIHPHYQRQGIGTRLLTQGLQLADSGEPFPLSISSQTSPSNIQTHPHPQPKPPIQVILGASPWGIGLYRKHGFQEVYSMDIRLDLYEGERDGKYESCYYEEGASWWL
ncbi:d2271565-b347-45bc-bd89-eb1a1ed987a8 [Sclerotinia trifoliorum]|uniref:D2271565-b347-45bc-bd89-eb1a1ed987a8 n=1 Tax=Sclerotinia trifoliorum TaxID=28548 RepID=A0A8H2ZPS5_9HELO|nr:d2271565-b347-45bc-bd89-eb1a1ed987a8 [Sclerotinia trifoliorum]